MPAAPRERRSYAFCIRFCAVPPACRLLTSRQVLAHYRRVAALPPKLGAALDACEAPFFVLRWVAWGKSTGTVQSRFDDVMRFRRLMGWWPPDATLSAAHPLGELVAKLEKIVGRKA